MTMNSRRASHLLMDMMDLVAAMPLFAMKTLLITLVPPFAATYSANLSCFVSAATGAGSATAALSFVSQFLAPSAARRLASLVRRRARRQRALKGMAACNQSQGYG